MFGVAFVVFNLLRTHPKYVCLLLDCTHLRACGQIVRWPDERGVVVCWEQSQSFDSDFTHFPALNLKLSATNLF